MNNGHPPNKLLTCTGCSLLCNDVSRVEDASGKGPSRAQFVNACEKGKSYLNRLANPIDQPATISGVETSTPLAVKRTVADLMESGMPLICGLSDQSCETQVAAIELARQMNAAIDWTSDISPFAWHAALQQVGRVSCSFSELAKSADLLVIWSADPDSSHPRLFESLSGEVVVIDHESNETDQRASRSFSWGKAQQQTALRYLRERLAGIADSPDSNDKSFGEQLRWLHEKLLSAAYPVFVVDEHFAELHGNTGAMSLSMYVRALNRRNHCRLIQLGFESNHRGASETFTSLTGAPFGILFREHEPLFRGRDASSTRLIRRGTVDLIVVVGHQIPESLSSAISISDARSICIGSAYPEADIVIPSKRWGIDEAGTGIASDGTPVNAPAYCESALTSPSELIADIRRQIPNAMITTSR